MKLITLQLFFVFSGRPLPLRSDHATVRGYDHVCHLLCVHERTEGESTFLELAAWWKLCVTTLSLQCVYSAGRVRWSVCDAVVPRATVRNTAYGKRRGVTQCILYFVNSLNNFVPLTRIATCGNNLFTIFYFDWSITLLGHDSTYLLSHFVSSCCLSISPLRTRL